MSGYKQEATEMWENLAASVYCKFRVHFLGQLFLFLVPSSDESHVKLPLTLTYSNLSQYSKNVAGISTGIYSNSNSIISLEFIFFERINSRLFSVTMHVYAQVLTLAWMPLLGQSGASHLPPPPWCSKQSCWEPEISAPALPWSPPVEAQKPQGRLQIGSESGSKSTQSS